MLKGAIARRYAGAMFEIGSKQNQLDRTLKDVQEIAQIFAHRKLAYLLQEPKVPAQRKETAIRQALTSKVLPTSLNLALLVVQRDLVEIMPNIARELEQLVMNFLQTRTEPAILGGVVARVGDQVIDGSVRYRLNALRQQLLHSAASSSAGFLSEAGNNGLSAPAEQLAQDISQPTAQPSGKQ